MSKVTEQIAKVKSNPVGAGVGAIAGYLVAIKLVKSDSLLVKIGATALGLIAGSMIQAKMKSNKGVPTPAIIGK